MQQPVTTRHDVHECTEFGDIHDFTVVVFVQLRLRGETNGQNAFLGHLHRRSARSTDTDGSVVFDLDGGTGIFFELTDVLTLWPDDLTNAILGDLDGFDLRSVLSKFLAWRRKNLGHLAKNEQASIARLHHGTGEHLRRKRLDLRIELQRGDHIFRPGDLEVHVTEMIFGTQDIRERDEFTVLLDQAHRNTGNGSMNRDTGIHEG
ncbi:hypothetical protein BMS3Bbin02_01357 [bacterium BMS3Bbin02]|nr:hypothetical protein BMS3Bbin02_01357 [bacterium BMS3Bbin02]